MGISRRHQLPSFASSNFHRRLSYPRRKVLLESFSSSAEGRKSKIAQEFENPILMMQRAEASEWNIKRAIARLVLSPLPPPPPRSSFYLHSADAALMQFVEVSSPPPSSSLYLHFDFLFLRRNCNYADACLPRSFCSVCLLPSVRLPNVLQCSVRGCIRRDLEMFTEVKKLPETPATRAAVFTFRF